VSLVVDECTGVAVGAVGHHWRPEIHESGGAEVIMENGDRIKHLKSLAKKATIEELYVLHGLVLFAQDINRRCGNELVAGIMGQGEAAVIHEVGKKGGYKKKT
jgi:hypothetical protein